jgi:hypothetical protein
MAQNNFYKLTPYYNLIVAEFFGSWDMNITKEYLEDAFKIISKNYSDKPYAVLDDCRKWELNTPDAIQFWKETYTKKDINFPTHVAYVVGDSTLKTWVIERMIEKTVSFEGAIFVEIHEALTWLESHGYGGLHRLLYI